MKLPEALKHGIQTGDWNIICKIYTGITGEPIEPPQPKEPNWADMDIPFVAYTPTIIHDDKIVTIEAPGKPIEPDIASSLVQEEEPVILPASAKTGEDKPARREQMTIPEANTRENKFTDNPNAFPNERVEVSPQLGAVIQPRKSKVDRSLTEVSCGICNKTEKVSVSLAGGYSPTPNNNRYRCNTCCTSQRRRDE